MRVVHTLHEHTLARQQPDVGTMVPKRVTMSASILFVSEFFKGSEVPLLFQEVYYSATNDPVNKPQNLTRLLNPVRDDVKMVRHDDVGED